MWTDLIQASVQKSGTQWSSQLLSFGCRRLGLQFSSSTIQKPLVWRPRAALRTSLSRFFGSPPHPVALWHILKRWCLCKDLLLSIVCNAPKAGSSTRWSKDESALDSASASESMSWRQKGIWIPKTILSLPSPKSVGGARSLTAMSSRAVRCNVTSGGGGWA